MKNIICITPIKHIDGMYEKLERCGNIIYEPEITKYKLKKALFDLRVEYLLTIANKQNFILDEEVLNGSQLKVINTCSTGLNHIDLDYCIKNEILEIVIRRL